MIDKRNRIFRRIGPTRHGEIDFPPPRPYPPEDPARRVDAQPVITRFSPRAPLAELARRALLEAHTSPGVMVDRDYQVLYYHGDVRPYIQLSGEATRDLLLLARDGVRGAVRVALHHAAHGERGVASDGWIDAADGRRRVEVTASPVPVPDDGPALDYYMVSFEERGMVAPAAAPGEEPGDEARRLRGELQGVIEELQTSNEELKAAHEEATSVNEELQSANEELETGKEEMQSLNEELRAVNGQLRTKMDELQSAASDLTSLLASTDLAVLFLDTGLRIRRYTPAVKELFGPIPGDVGRPLSDLARRFEDPHLDDDCRAVLDRLLAAEREVAGANGRHYLRRANPYRTTDNRIDGVVLTFVDVTARKLAEDAVRAGEERLRHALSAARMGIWTLDVANGMHMRDANLNGLLGLPANDSTQPFNDFIARVHPEDRASVRAAFDASTREGQPLRVEFRVVWPNGTVRWLRDQGDMFGNASQQRRMAGACVDVTERREAEEALRRSEERQRLILESATDYAILSLEPDRTVTTWSPGAEATFGYTGEEIVGRSADILFTPEDRAAKAPEAEATEARRTGRAVDERWHLRKDGTRFYASGVMRPLRDGGGFVKVARDLTDRKQMEDELRDARDRLETRVAERTADLERALDSLEAEMSRRRELARRLEAAQEDERRRLAHDLHDTVGQLLAGLSLTLKSIENSGHLPPGEGRLTEAQRIMNELGRELHGLAVRLRPTSLDDVGLEPALGQLVSDWSSRSGIKADFHVYGLEPEGLPSEVETAVYRVVQEALTNVARHSKATNVSVVVTRPEEFVSVAIEDNGVGFDPVSSPKGRIGLLGMKERVELIGGTLEIESSPGAGTTIAVRIPIPKGSTT